MAGVDIRARRCNGIHWWTIDHGQYLAQCDCGWQQICPTADDAGVSALYHSNQIIYRLGMISTALQVRVWL